VIIRCERCSTMYELDESLLAPGGSPVQCTKCDHVFTAVPPRPAGKTLGAVQADPPSAPPAEQPSRAGGTPSVPPPAAPAASPRNGSSPRPVSRSAPAPVYRPPSTVPPTTVGRAPVLRQNAVGSFEARLRWSARWRWLAPVIAVALVAAVVAGILLLRRGGHGTAERARAEALALVALDDAASLDEAAARLGEIVRGAPKLKAAAADRALALALRAAGQGEERDALASRLAARSEERERLRQEAQPGFEEKERAAAAEAVALEAQVRATEERARALSSAADEQVRALQADVGDTPEVVRAAAALHAVHGEKDAVQKLARGERERGRRDPWVDLADGWMDARDPDRAGRERALVRLGSVVAARPDLLRGRFLLARAEASLGRRAEALAAVDAILSANARHEGARRLREELTAAPPPAPSDALPAPVPPPASKASPPARKTIPQPVPGPSPAASPAPAAPASQGAAGAAATGEPASPPPPISPPAPAAAPEPQPAPEAAPAPTAPSPPPALPRRTRAGTDGELGSGG
jgi:predicted Zn finger-like uncharacterized protein